MNRRCYKKPVLPGFLAHMAMMILFTLSPVIVRADCTGCTTTNVGGGCCSYVHIGRNLHTAFYGTPPELTVIAININGDVTNNYGDTNPSDPAQRFWKLASAFPEPMLIPPVMAR